MIATLLDNFIAVKINVSSVSFSGVVVKYSNKNKLGGLSFVGITV